MKKKDYTWEIIGLIAGAWYAAYIYSSSQQNVTTTASSLGVKVDTDILSDIVLAGFGINPLYGKMVRGGIKHVAEKLQPRFGYKLGSLKNEYR